MGSMGSYFHKNKSWIMIDWKILTWRKLFPSSGLGGWNKSRKRRLRSFSLTYKGTTLSPLGLLKQGPLASIKFFFKFNLSSIFTKKLVENHEYRIKDLKVRVSRQATIRSSRILISCFRLSRKLIRFMQNPFDPLGEQHITLALLSLFSPERWWGKQLLCLLVN